ncbi:TlpA family protein disulfide reductase [Gillisia sp. Q332]|uniref:TlpA family protein disulfide reductase n=1 Tax=Gillisia xinjiangensis TaxID=3384765 RepID=UPI00391A1D6C
MKKKTKKSLIEYGIIIAIFGGLYITGLHTEVLGFLQRGILATGIMNPDLDKKDDPAVIENNPQADFSMKLINSKGEQVAMEELRGKVIFMNIWATWCPPCVAEMPGINKLYKDVDKENVAFIMLSVDQDFQKAIDYNNRKGYDFEVYEAVGGMPQMYHSQSIPTTYVIDSEGNLVLTHMGMGDYNTKDFKEFLEDQI